MRGWTEERTNHLRQSNIENKPSQYSTGARTSEGKAKISQNALKHPNLSKTRSKKHFKRIGQSFKLLEKIAVNLHRLDYEISQETWDLIEDWMSEYAPIEEDTIIINGAKVKNYLPSDWNT
ncbi:MAG: hypothetical protein AB4063_19705 [Crocosphaera sp.]